jgi:hypothetical protein
MIDNFELIKQFLKFKEGDFYFLQIIRRRKENPDENNNNRIIKTYYISTLEYYDSIQDEIKKLCKFFNARAYIGLNRRNYKKLAFYMLKEVTDKILNDQFWSVKSAFDSVCGQYTTGDKLWIVDLDFFNEDVINVYTDSINKCQSGFEVNVLGKIPTLNGWHLITRPFNIKEFTTFEEFPVDIHKNNPTLLYYKDGKEIE